LQNFHEIFLKMFEGNDTKFLGVKISGFWLFFLFLASYEDETDDLKIEASFSCYYYLVMLFYRPCETRKSDLPCIFTKYGSDGWESYLNFALSNVFETSPPHVLIECS